MHKQSSEIGLLVLRLTLGIIFLAHGWQKVSGFAGIVQWFGSIGLPPLLAYAVTAIEFCGGIALLLGLFTRLAALGIIFVMIGAIFSVKLQAGFIGGYEYDVALIAIAAALVLNGSSLAALDSRLAKRKE